MKLESNNRLEPFYKTSLGSAYQGDTFSLIKQVPDESIDLVLTSPPYALHFKKEYGNENQDEYVEWFISLGGDLKRVLKPTGSFVLNIGGSWEPGRPTRSLCHFEVLIKLVKDIGFYLAQEFYWYNPAKLPVPAEWVTVRKLRVKDSVECLWWLSKTPEPKASNEKVLREYSDDMKRLIKKGYRTKRRPSGHNITHKFQNDRGGSIPDNILIFGNNDSTGYYLKRCKESGLKVHPARFPIQLPTFFIKFLTEPGDIVLDPFAGSNTTGEAAERLGRKWLSFEREEEYLIASSFRFEGLSDIITKEESIEKCAYTPNQLNINLK